MILIEHHIPTIDAIEASKQLLKMMINKEIKKIPIAISSNSPKEENWKICEEIGISHFCKID